MAEQSDRRLDEGAGAMAQELRAPVALAEFRGSLPSTRMATHNHLLLKFKGIQCLLRALPGHQGMFVEHRPPCRQSTHF